MQTSTWLKGEPYCTCVHSVGQRVGPALIIQGKEPLNQFRHNSMHEVVVNGKDGH